MPRLAAIPARVVPTERTAATADPFELYRLSVQDPPFDARVLSRFYTHVRGKLALTLREDFCGTFAVCCEWAKSHPQRVSYGVDLDAETLAWGRKHHLAELSDDQKSRVHLLKDDVLTAKTPPVDVVFAGNYSYFIWKTREDLRTYFKAVHGSLKGDGVFVLDMMGGSECFEDDIEHARRVKDFVYVWEHETFNPVTHEGVFHIHFRFKDKTELTRAFTYDWRVWTMPELREVLTEAGFKKVDVFADTDSGYRKREKMDADPSWLAYLVAQP